MKIKPSYIIIAALIVAVIVLSVILAKTTDKYSIVVGQLQEAVKVKDIVIAEKDKVIEAAAIENIELDKKLYSSQQVIGQMTSTIGQAQAGEAAAAAESAKLKTEVQPAIDANPKLKAFVLSLESRLTQKDGIILTLEARDVERVQQIASWRGKFDAQVQASEAWKAKYDAQERIASLSGEALKLANRKLRRTQILSNVGKISLVGLGGYVLYDKLKGSK